MPKSFSEVKMKVDQDEAQLLYSGAAELTMRPYTGGNGDFNLSFSNTSEDTTLM